MLQQDMTGHRSTRKGAPALVCGQPRERPCTLLSKLVKVKIASPDTQIKHAEAEQKIVTGACLHLHRR